MARRCHTFKATVHTPKTVVRPNECYRELSFFTRPPSALHACTQHWACRHARAVQQGAVPDNGHQRLTALLLLSPPAPPQPVSPLHSIAPSLRSNPPACGVYRQCPLLPLTESAKAFALPAPPSRRPDDRCLQKLQSACGTGDVVELAPAIDWRCCTYHGL